MSVRNGRMPRRRFGLERAVAMVALAVAIGCPAPAIADQIDPAAIAQMRQRVQKMSPEQRQMQWNELPPTLKSTVRASLEAGAQRKPGRPVKEHIRKIPAFTAKYR